MNNSEIKKLNDQNEKLLRLIRSIYTTSQEALAWDGNGYSDSYKDGYQKAYEQVKNKIEDLEMK